MAESLRNFQLSFGKYLRDPQQQPLPAGIPPRAAKVYDQLLFNNVRGFIDACFPVCKSLATSSAWTTLARQFFRDWRCHSPVFNDIPGEFLSFLQNSSLLEDLPPWFFELAHYEWVELYLETWDEAKREKRPPGQGIRVDGPLLNLAYHWPVHRISKGFEPDKPRQTFLLVLRNRQQRIDFIEVNALTSILVNLAESGACPRTRLIQQTARVAGRHLDASFVQHAEQLIEQLIAQGVLSEHR